MKPFESLAEQELVALSDEDITRYIDYACAENGVSLLPAKLPEPPTVTAPEPDRTVYAVGRMYSHDIICTKSDEAQRLADLLNQIQTVTLTYVPGPITERAIEPARGAFLVQPQQVFSAELAATIRPALDDHARAQKLYDTAKKEYDAAIAARAAYASEIRSKVEEAWQTHNRREDLRRHHARYLELADGNREIAVRFLQNAHRDAPTLLPELFILAEPEAVSA